MGRRDDRRQDRTIVPGIWSDCFTGLDEGTPALNIHDADIHEVPVNEYFHRHTGVNTTLTAATTGGVSTSITVASVTGFAIGNLLHITDGNYEVTFQKITNIAGLVITLDRPLDQSFAIGDTVSQVVINMNVLGTLAAPVSYKITPHPNQIWHIVSFILGITHSTAADDSAFGDIAALTNGVVLRGYNAASGQYRTFTNWKSNGDIKMDMGNVVYTDKAGGGLFGVTGDGSIRERTGAAPRIDSTGITTDFLEILIQDDLTALTSLRLKAQGHIEG